MSQRLTSTLMIMLFSTVTAFTRSFLDPSLDSYRRTYRSLLLFHSAGSSSDFLSLGPGWEDTRVEEEGQDFKRQSYKRPYRPVNPIPHFTDEGMEIRRKKKSKALHQVRSLGPRSLDSCSWSSLTSDCLCGTAVEPVKNLLPCSIIISSPSPGQE